MNKARLNAILEARSFMKNVGVTAQDVLAYEELCEDVKFSIECEVKLDAAIEEVRDAYHDDHRSIIDCQIDERLRIAHELGVNLDAIPTENLPE